MSSTTIHRFSIALAGLGLAGGLMVGVAGTMSPAVAMGKIKCDADGSPTVALAKVDPIVNHNGTAPTHEHQFFGNKAWLNDLANPNTANWDDLAGHATNCRVATDTAGYWMPSLRYVSGAKAGQVLPAKQFTAYYRPFTGMGSKTGPGIALPADTRLVSSPGRAEWNCGQNSGDRSVRVPAIPDCTGLSGKPGYTLTAHVDFPSCWDGVAPRHNPSDVGNTSDNSHYAYPVSKACPKAFPIQMTQLHQTVQFPYVGAGNDLALSSDAMMNTSDGRSLHADFFNAWNQPAFVQFVKDCVNTGGNFTNAKCQP
jgi:hypothetical protein